ncbi:MAG: tyrosine-type recombinase/integrase [Myxococcota bacterium]
MASYTKRGEGWSIRWRDPDGTSRRRQVPDARTRDTLLREIDAAHALGRRWEPAAVGVDHSMAAAAVGYLRAVRRRLRPRTVESQARTIADFLDWVGARIRRQHVGVDVLSRKLMLAHYDDMVDRGLALSTAKVRISHLRQFWAWCHDDEDFGEHTPRPRKIDVASPTPRETIAPTWEQMDAMIMALSLVHYQRLATVLRCTGLRKVQAMGLRWSDIDLDRGTLYVRPELGKTRQERSGRVVPLPPVLLDEIASWGQRRGWLIDWPTEARKPHSGTIEHAWRLAGVDERVWRQRTVHCLRKGHASGLRELGANHFAVEYLQGRTMGVAGTYTDPRALPLAEAVALVPPIGGDREAADRIPILRSVEA